MQKSAKPITRTQPSRKQSAPAPKQTLVRTGPQPLDAQQLRQVAGGTDLPHKGW